MIHHFPQEIEIVNPPLNMLKMEEFVAPVQVQSRHTIQIDLSKREPV